MIDAIHGGIECQMLQVSMILIVNVTCMKIVNLHLLVAFEVTVLI